ncbi:MAG TPA: YceI family protein, partial [Pirellulaceae bacterium]
ADHPVKIQNGSATWGPGNALVQFTGTHMGAEPNPRVGHFQKFAGKAKLNANGKDLESVELVVDTTSLWTPIPNLTNHLQSPDFLDVREYPKATFQSTAVESGGDEGQVTIVGKFTLHGTTQELKIPAEVQVTDAGLTLVGSFTLDRGAFGMDQLQDRVVNEVGITVVIGLKP